MFFCITWDVNNVKKVLTVDLESYRKNQLPLDVTLQKMLPYISIYGLSENQLHRFFTQSRLCFGHNQVYSWRGTHIDLPQWLHCEFECQKPRWQTKIQDKICFQFVFWRIGPPILSHKHQLSTSVSPVACEKDNWALTRHIHYIYSSHEQQYLLFNSEILQKLMKHPIFGGVELRKWSFSSYFCILEQPTGTVT